MIKPFLCNWVRVDKALTEEYLLLNSSASCWLTINESIGQWGGSELTRIKTWENWE